MPNLHRPERKEALLWNKVFETNRAPQLQQVSGGNALRIAKALIELECLGTLRIPSSGIVIFYSCTLGYVGSCLMVLSMFPGGCE